MVRASATEPDTIATNSLIYFDPKQYSDRICFTLDSRKSLGLIITRNPTANEHSIKVKEGIR